jgi:hypothetical protein
VRNFRLDDIVIIADNNMPRNTWHLGRIVETHPGADGLVRSAKVTTKAGVFVRSVHKLCLLEGID